MRGLIVLSVMLFSGSVRAAGLPDWSGWWNYGTPLPEEFIANPPPARSADLQGFAAVRAGNSQGDPLRYCRPPQFTGWSGGLVEAVEFLFVPGRVILLNESGLIRRIYTDGRPLPADIDDSNTGISVGHWEGETLVVETTHINPAAMYPGPQQGSVPIGRGARISERIRLKGPDTLVFEITTIAPEVLARADRRSREYVRSSKPIANEITFCTEYDRSIEPGTGKQRFDLTPPADLPPPPPLK